MSWRTCSATRSSACAVSSARSSRAACGRTGSTRCGSPPTPTTAPASCWPWFAATGSPRGLTAGFGGRIALTDGVIHHQDIRRPLGLPRDIPADRLHAVLDFARTAPTIGARKRIRGLTLVATDLDWAAGRGPVVEGPAEALLMVIAGRRGVARELTGPGLPTIADRIGT